MKLVASVAEMQGDSLSARQSGQRVALVPTMGALHEGHLSLIRLARKDADLLVVSIFVNPTQFSPTEDLDQYPRPLERDAALCRAEGVDVLFNPSPPEMYESGCSLQVVSKSLIWINIMPGA